MRVLLDECVDPRLKAVLANHSVRTVAELSWDQLTDTDLLARAEREFDVLVTIDKGIEHQQNVASLDLGVVIVSVPKNKVEYYRPFLDDLERAIQIVQRGAVLHVGRS